MSNLQIAPSLADLPVGGAPSEEALRHHSPIFHDPGTTGQSANAYFQTPPASIASAPPAPIASAPAPFGLPVTTPNLTDAPTPSIVTSIAPLAPARAPYGPPDVSQTTIPSVVPTPNIPAPSAPTSLQSSTRPLGLADVPQPGASPGGATSPAVPGEIDYSAIPRLLEGDLSLVPTAHLGVLGADVPAGAVPGGVAPANYNSLYFLHDRVPPTQAPSQSQPSNWSVSLIDPAHLTPATAPRAAVGMPLNVSQASYGLSGPLEADQRRRLSDIASPATPPASAPFSSGYQSSVERGVQGPAVSDALYFVSHSGGHERAVDAKSGQPNDRLYSFEPQVVASAEPTREPVDQYGVRRDLPVSQQPQSTHSNPRTKKGGVS
jgi:cysteine desulfurase/selenocysteine lyase